MKYYTITLRLAGAPAVAVAVEWTNQPASLDGDPGWEPCLRLVDGAWRFSSREPFGTTPPHKCPPGAFGDLAIRYRLSAAGPWSEASANRKDVMIVEVTDEPQAGDPLPVAPILVAAPVLAGSGKIGSEVTVTAGLWNGCPAPRISFQWRRNEAAIPGAVFRAYVPSPADDLTALACVVTARNDAGATETITTAVAVTYPVPTRVGDLPDEIFDEDTGPQLVETDFVFLGENLAYTASSGTIDPLTGVLTVSTDQPISGQTVTITAANSGGKVSAAVMITVEAAPPKTLPAPAPFSASDVAIVRCDWRPAGQALNFSPILSFPKLTPAQRATVQIQFRASPLTDTGAAWQAVAPLAFEPGRYWLPDNFASAWPTINLSLWQDNARRIDRLRFRHRFADNQEWSTDSSTIDIPLPVKNPEKPTSTPDVTVSSVADLVTEVYRTSPLRRVIAVAPGIYSSNVNFSTKIKRAVDDTVYIVPADYNNPPVFTKEWSFADQCSGIHINGLSFLANDKITGAVGGTPYGSGGCKIAAGDWPLSGNTAITAGNVNRFAVTNCRFDFWDIVMNAGAASGVAGEYTVEQIRPAGFDINSIHGQPTISRNIRFEYNTVTRTGMDVLRLYNNCQFTVRGNRSTNPRADAARASCDATRHCDFVQLACGRLAIGSFDYVIEDNYAVGIDGYYQMITMINERCARLNGDTSSIGGFANEPNGRGNIALYGHRNGIIRGNELSAGQVAGVYHAGCHNVLTEINVLRPIRAGLSNSDKPALAIIGPNQGIIRNNAHDRDEANGIHFNRSGSGTATGQMGTMSGITASGNIRTTTGFPAGWAERHPNGLFVKTGQYGYNGGVQTATIP